MRNVNPSESLGHLPPAEDMYPDLPMYFYPSTTRDMSNMVTAPLTLERFREAIQEWFAAVWTIDPALYDDDLYIRHGFSVESPMCPPSDHGVCGAIPLPPETWNPEPVGDETWAEQNRKINDLLMGRTG